MILYAFSVYDLMRVIKDGPNVSGTRGYRVLDSIQTLFEDAVRGIGLTAIPHQLLSGEGSLWFPQSYKIADNIYSVPMVASQQNWGASSSSSSFIRKVDYYEGAFHANIGIVFHSEHRNYTHNLFRVGGYTFTLVNIDGAATLNMNGIPVADISYSSPVYSYSLVEVVAGDQLEVYIDQKLVFTYPHSQELLIEDFELYFSTAGVWYSHFILSDGREGGGRLGKVRVKTVPLATKDGEFGDFYGTFDPDTIAVGSNSLHRSNSEYVEVGSLNTSEAYTSKIGDKIDASIDFDESLEVIAVQVSAIGRKEEPSQPDSTLVIGEAETRRMSGHLANHTFVIPPTKEFSLEIGVHRERMLRPYEFARVPAENLDIYKFEVYDQRRAMLTNTLFSASISFVEAPEYDYYNEIPMMHAALQASMQYVDASEYEKIEEIETPFKGEVPASELITGDALASLVGLTAGTSINSNEPWLKFEDPVDGITKYIAKKPFRNLVSWDDLSTANLVYGRTINIGSTHYRVRLIQGYNRDPVVGAGGTTDYDGTLTFGTEWNRLVYPIIPSPKHWDEPTLIPNFPLSREGIEFGSWASYTEVDLQIALVSVVPEVDYQLSTRCVRGGGSVIRAWNTGSSTVHAWRPILEELGNPTQLKLKAEITPTGGLLPPGVDRNTSPQFAGKFVYAASSGASVYQNSIETHQVNNYSVNTKLLSGSTTVAYPRNSNCYNSGELQVQTIHTSSAPNGDIYKDQTKQAGTSFGISSMYGIGKMVYVLANTTPQAFRVRSTGGSSYVNINASQLGQYGPVSTGSAVLCSTQQSSETNYLRYSTDGTNFTLTNPVVAIGTNARISYIGSSWFYVGSNNSAIYTLYSPTLNSRQPGELSSGSRAPRSVHYISGFLIARDVTGILRTFWLGEPDFGTKADSTQSAGLRTRTRIALNSYPTGWNQLSYPALPVASIVERWNDSLVTVNSSSGQIRIFGI